MLIFCYIRCAMIHGSARIQFDSLPHFTPETNVTVTSTVVPLWFKFLAMKAHLQLFHYTSTRPLQKTLYCAHVPGR